MAGDEVFAWLTSQPDWQQDLARRLTTQVALVDGEYDDALCMVKTRFGVPIETLPEGTPAPLQPCTRDDLHQPATEARAKLLSFGSLQGVGLVSQTDALNFEPAGMTLVYGQNAAGKSSYVRALKALCRTVDRGCQVRSSIYEASPATAASAKVEINVDGVVTAQRTSLNRTAALRLPGLSVFDSACAELYVNTQNLVQYIPPDLRLLARLAAVQDRMRQALAAERQTLQDCAPALDAYPMTTEVGRALAQLRGSDDDPDLAALATLTEEQQTRLVELRALVAAAAASTSRDEALAARREAVEASALADAVTTLAACAAEPAAARLRLAAVADMSAQRAVKLAAEQLADAAPGVGSEPWQVLWEAARTFVAGQEGVFPPGEGQPCPLCQEPVTATTATRLAHFEEHVTSTVRKAASTAADALEAAVADCAADKAGSCRLPLLTALKERDQKLAQALEGLIDGLAAHLEAMTTNPATAAAAAVDTTKAVAALTAWSGAREARAATLLTADDPEALRRATQELAELEARERLRGSLTAFNTWREHLQTIEALNAAHSALATNRITTAQRDLTESEVGKALDAALTEELRKLSCTHLPVELHTRTAQAETRVGLRLLATDETKLAEIVSDGERRALALAFFLAELTVVDDAGGIVVDDPVSSLDDERCRYIADRLVAEAATRQVIVFTHDLAFLLDLQNQAEERGVPLRTQGVWRLGNVVGRVDDDLPFKTMKLKARVGKLNEMVARWDADPKPANQDEAWDRIEKFYKRLRTSWERAVEERLFKGVVQRFQREVKTKSLKNVEITPELLKQIEEGMTRASTFLHDEPPVHGSVPLPTRTDLAADLDLLVQFEAQVKPN